MDVISVDSVASYSAFMPKKARSIAQSPRPNRIRELTKEHRKTYGIIADHFSVHYVTIANLARGKSNLTQAWMKRLGDYFGVPPEEIIATPAMPHLRRVRVKGELRAGAWDENHEWPFDDQYDVFIPDEPSLRRLSLYAGRIGGESMNLRYPNGSVIVLSHVGDSPTEIVPGRRYHVRLTRSDGQTEETIKTLIRKEDGRYWLKPESSEPEFQEWIPLDGRPGATVELVGRVRFAVHKED